MSELHSQLISDKHFLKSSMKQHRFRNTSSYINHHDTPCGSLQRSFWGVKDLALGNLGGGPSISEPRVLQKKEELLEESLTTGPSSLCADPATSGSQATINYHLGLCYRLYVEGDGRQAFAFRQICGTLLKGLRTAETPF